jgi:dCMP deaminase
MLSNWDRMYMDMTMRVSWESKCSAKKVGCLLVKDNNILAVGINGTFSGAKNCCDKFVKRSDGVWLEYREDDIYECEDQEAHHKWSLINEVHAEMNAIAKAHKNGVSVEGATAYVTHSPCFNCAKELYTHGIKRIIFIQSYDDIQDIIDLLSNFKIQLISYNEEKDLLEKPLTEEDIEFINSMNKTVEKAKNFVIDNVLMKDRGK